MPNRILSTVLAGTVCVLSLVPCTIAFQELLPTPSIVKGIVLNDVTGMALEGVDIRRPVPRSVADVPPPSLSDTSVPEGREPIFTDANGTFTANNISVSSGMLEFRKAGFESKQIRLALSGGQTVSRLAVRMKPLGVISGHVITNTGGPATRVAVTPYRVDRETQALSPSRAAVVDDRGEFRLYDLAPGQYIIGYGPPGWAEGSYAPAADAVAPILYPGVRNLTQAEKISVPSIDSDREVRLQNVVVGALRLGKIKVSVKNLGEFKNVEVSLRPIWGAGYPLLPDGVRPEGYQESAKLRLEANALVSKEFWPNAPLNFMIRIVWVGPNGATISNVSAVQYQGEDMDVHIELTDSKGVLQISGVEIQESETKPLSGARLTLCKRAIGYNCKESELWLYLDRAQTSIPVLNREGKFTSIDIPNGEYDIYSVSLGRDLYIASIMQGERDALNEGLSISENGIPISIIARRGAAKLRGIVLDAQGVAISNALVKLVPVSSTSRLFSMRPTTTTSQDGSFEIDSIVPSQYRIYASKEDDPRDPIDLAIAGTESGMLLSLVESDVVSIRLPAMIAP